MVNLLKTCRNCTFFADVNSLYGCTYWMCRTCDDAATQMIIENHSRNFCLMRALLIMGCSQDGALFHSYMCLYVT
mgnify:CR=1 FL=1